MKTKLILVLGACVLLGANTASLAETPVAGKAAAKKKIDAAKASEPLPTAGDFECAWTGKRVVSLLARDDVDAATNFARFYTSFQCPNPHIGKALGCAVSPDAMGDGETMEARVDRCWIDPRSKPFPPATAQAKTAKDAKNAKDNGVPTVKPYPERR